MKKNKINIKNNRCIINVLGELCWGVYVDNFEKKIGNKKEVVEEFLERLLKAEREGIAEICINNSESELIRRAFDEVFRQIDEWEFQTRMGISIEEAIEVEKKIEHA